MSLRDVRAPSSVPNMLSNPRVRSIRKNMMAHSGATGNWLMASVKAMNANPVPEADCSTSVVLQISISGNSNKPIILVWL